MEWVVSAEHVVKRRNASRISIGKHESKKSLGENLGDMIL
jgi:hypothetical protein